ncbi:MrcB family domain-containing protein [Streptomyces sp. NPDC050161]|uniref:MrcB family domain-containing protein n=1 Tax=Streptomyces sp. NPDC050161 TaxID=3365604 RepID=UPI0037ADEB46
MNHSNQGGGYSWLIDLNYFLCMGIRDLLLDVATTFDTTLTTTSGNPGQAVLKAASERLADALPYGMKATGHGGQGGAAATPWIRVFDPSAGGSGTNGLYLAYIFSADLASVTLTLQQGVTAMRDELRTRGQRLRNHLAFRARALLAELPHDLVADWTDRPQLRHHEWRPRAYEASSVAGRCYDIAKLPSEGDLCADLGIMGMILKAALDVEAQVQVVSAPDGPTVEYVPQAHATYRGLEGFHPKTGDDYVAEIIARQQTKKQVHEGLIRSFGPYIHGRGFIPITERAHPRDLVLRSGGDNGAHATEWLVEAKAVKKGNATQAVREAVGQLLEYSYFLYSGMPKPHLLGLFSEEIGVYTTYLEDHGIGAIWRTKEGWAGSASAIAWGMAEAQQ